jgi:putative oxidoreductase
MAGKVGRWIRASVRANGPGPIILIRLLTGGVFLAEGIKKFMFPAQWGEGRLAHIGIPWPDIIGPFVGGVEIVCGTLLILGLLTRLASIPLLIDICVAIATTKIPILLKSGFWAMEDPARTDYSMLMSLLFLLAAGGGRWSLDRLFSRGTHVT